MKVATAIPRRSIASLLTFSRPFTSSNAKIVKIEIPPNISEPFCDELKKYHEPFENPDFKFKPITKGQLDLWFDKFQKVVAEDKVFSDRLAEVREIDPEVTVIGGILFPEFPQEKIPQEDFEINYPVFVKAIRPATIAISIVSRLLGVENQSIGDVFGTKRDKDRIGSFKSSVPLKWHNDGWKYGADECVVLLGVVGNKNVQTEIITYRDIIDHFKKNQKEGLLQELNDIFTLGEMGEEMLPQQIRILNKEEGKINFAHYANFSHYIPESKKDAISYLKQSLEEIPPIVVNIETGTLVKIKNEEALHQRIPNPSPDIANQGLVGNRLLKRLSGTLVKR